MVSAIKRRFAMNGIDFVADTNFLIGLHEGKSFAKPFLDKVATVSIISEIELLGWPKISELEKRRLKQLLDDCVLIDLSPEIRAITIRIRQQQKIKLPDAIVAATSL